MNETQRPICCPACGGLLSARCVACDEATRPDPDRHLFGCIMFFILLLVAMFAAGVWTGAKL